MWQRFFKKVFGPDAASAHLRLSIAAQVGWIIGICIWIPGLIIWVNMLASG